MTHLERVVEKWIPILEERAILFGLGRTECWQLLRELEDAMTMNNTRWRSRRINEET